MSSATARRAGAIGLPVLGAAAIAAAVTLADEGRREQLRRSARIWRLTARRGIHWGVIRVRGVGKDAEARAALDEHFAIRTAEDVAKELGNMKGAIMKAGQMFSFIAEGLPPEARAALATLQADVPPMAPTLAEQVVREELGADPDRLFLDWNPEPVAAASIGQVHKAVLRDGREVAVKVQYPGVDRAIKGDLDNAELLYGLFSQFAMKNMDVKGIVDELRDRMGDELDYRIEARNQQEVADLYRGHPWVRVPAVVHEHSARRVLTTEWVDGMRWDELLASGSREVKEHAGEVLFRFAQGSINSHGLFNGDPHPGNYRFHHDGSVTFLDFGLVKRWTPGELEQMQPVLDATLARDPQGAHDAMVAARFLPEGNTVDPQLLFDYLQPPWEPYMVEQFTFTRPWLAEMLGKMINMQGPILDIVRQLNMPASYVILDRVVWGMSALLAHLEASGPWGAILAEYRKGAPPATELGRQEAAWRATRAATA
ncbi:MAG TPA: AarF/ABC1/UbiB kinase family protein [Acidimicrobiales bacterium]|nr:AarF/ABC1/UbiB kinase family protein [Acidimicrobiales bacterium]